MIRHARFETDSATRYLETLCKHFGRKVAVQCDGGTGWVQFPFGRCAMQADAAALTLRATAPDEGGLARVVEIMTSHLDRYAFRENPALAWHETPENPTSKEHLK